MFSGRSTTAGRSQTGAREIASPSNRRLLRLPRWQRWQWVLVGTFSVIFGLWLLAVALSSSLATSQVTVSESAIGIAPPNLPFDFGDLPANTSLTHTLVMDNKGKANTFVIIATTGDIKNFLSISDAFFNLKPGAEQKVRLRMTMPATAEPNKAYGGHVLILRLPWWTP